MISRSLFIARTRVVETLRYSRVLRTVRGLACWMKSRFPAHPAARLDWLCRAYQSCEHAGMWPGLAARVRRHLEQHRSLALEWKHAPGAVRYGEMRRSHPALSRSVVLKAPGAGGEKGVILSTFEYNWFRLVADSRRFEALCAEFHLVLSTSWSPTGYHILALAAAQAADTLFVQACNYDEVAKIEAFHPRLRCLETLPCDWLHPDSYRPRAPQDRDIDIVMVSNWAPFKRHWEFFNALRAMPAGLRVVCIGQPESGYTLEDIRALQRKLGAPQAIDYRQSLVIDQVADLQSRAKVALILSRREGCCVAAAEGMMAGAALAMRYDAHVGPRAYINEDNGALLHPRHLAAELDALIQRSDKTRAREFATRRLSCFESVRKLNGQLRAHDLAKGRPWTEDIAMPMWRPHPKLALEEDRVRLAPCYTALHQRWPDLFPADLIDQSCW
jgi:glycosyltransferase involved in cell wall biosynthesis